MVIALYVIALAMIGSGAASIAYGYGIVLNERGWTMVISGATGLSGGLVLLGIAVVAGRIKRIERELANVSQLARLGPGLALPRPPEAGIAAADELTPAAANSQGPVTPVGQEEKAVLKAADVIPEPGPPEPPRRGSPQRRDDDEADRPAPPTVVGTYNSGGNAYVMYSDGAIEADTPSGRYRFKSIEELKDFIAAGGEDGGPRNG
jgi:hypothetical protein